MSNKIDFSRPVTTRDGLPVKVLCTDHKDEGHNIVFSVYENGYDNLFTCYDNGRLNTSYETDYDLVNTNTKYINFYKDAYRGPSAHDTKEDAEQFAKDWSLFVSSRVRVDYQDGQLDE